MPVPFVPVSYTTSSMPIALPPAALIWSWVILALDKALTCAQLRPESSLFHRPAVREP